MYRLAAVGIGLACLSGEMGRGWHGVVFGYGRVQPAGRDEGVGVREICRCTEGCILWDRDVGLWAARKKGKVC